MKAAAVAVAAATALSVAAPEAHAGNRDWLRPDATGHCDWDGAGYWVQRCDVWSPAMNRSIPVLIQPSGRGGDAGFYLLDGMRADDNQTGWTMFADAPATYADSNINLIMPIGGAGSFYTDWDAPATFSGPPVLYRWETFLTSELPAYLQANFGVNPNRNSIAGLSMGGTAAMNLAARHPQQFQQVLSFSGYLTTTMPGMQTLLRMALIDTGGFNINSMYTSILSPRRFENDPFWNMDGLRGKDIYVSASTGLWTPADMGLPLGPRVMGWALENMARNSTAAWEMKARASGLNPTVDYIPAGVHNWGIWTDQLHRTKGRVLDVMGAW
nr:alpha/beta hydrolase family protein [Corynebacterium aquilae]